MYSIHKKLLNKLKINPTQNIMSEASSFSYAPSLTNIQKLDYFLKIIIRMNYEWSHAICNNVKSNHQFAQYTSSSYSVNNNKIHAVIYNLFNDKKNYYEHIEIDLGEKYKPPTNINKNNISAQEPHNRELLIQHAKNSTTTRVQFILDQLTYSRTNIHYDGFKTFDHRVIPEISNIRQGGSININTFLINILSKIGSNESEKQQLQDLLKTINIDILGEINFNYDNINIEHLNTYDKILDFIKNLNRTILIAMLEEKQTIFNEISLPFFNFGNKLNIGSIIYSLSIKFKLDDYFFLDIIIKLNKITNKNNKNNIDDFIDILYDYILNQKKIVKYIKNDDVYNNIKHIEHTRSYKLLIKLINYVLDNSTLQIKLSQDELNLDQIVLKEKYLDLLTFKNNSIKTKYIDLLEEIYFNTPIDTIKFNLYLVEYFKKVLMKLEPKLPDFEKEFYNMCFIYFNLCISYGHLYKTKNEKTLKLITIPNLKFDKIETKLKIKNKSIENLKKQISLLSIIEEENSMDLKSNISQK
jgi:hypothetical protein